MGFQSTRPRGARLNPKKKRVCGLTFQSTRPRGARPIILKEGIMYNKFQSTRPRGARLCLHFPPLHKQSFNPRAHAGRDRTCC